MYSLVAQALLFADQFFDNTYVASNLYGMCSRYNLNSKTYPKSNCICEHACKTRNKFELTPQKKSTENLNSPTLFLLCSILLPMFC